MVVYFLTVIRGKTFNLTFQKYNKYQTNKNLTSSFWMARILFFTASQFAFFPVMTIISELLFSAGRSIFVLVSSRIWKKKNSASQ